MFDEVPDAIMLEAMQIGNLIFAARLQHCAAEKFEMLDLEKLQILAYLVNWIGYEVPIPKAVTN